jgi:hypothetical protein
MVVPGAQPIASHFSMQKATWQATAGDPKVCGCRAKSGRIFASGFSGFGDPQRTSVGFVNGTNNHG